MRIQDNSRILTNKEYFLSFCYQDDLCRIYRMWLRYLDKMSSREAPIWEKERLYNDFLESDFDRGEWDYCSIKKETRKTGIILTSFKKKVMIYE